MRCKYSTDPNCGYKPSAKIKDREGTVLRENKERTTYIILWDGRKIQDEVGKAFIEIIPDVSNDSTILKP